MIPNFNIPFFISPLKEHNLIKETVLSMINKMNIPGYGNDPEEVDITKCDWALPANYPRNYLHVVTKPLINHLLESCKNIQCTNVLVHNFWFQQYEQNSIHNWHTHHDCQWTSVYYLEMNDNSPKTEIMNPYNSDDVFTLDVKEGDVLTFPSFIIHRAPRITNGIRKTIISFNSCFIYDKNDKKGTVNGMVQRY